MKESKTLVTWGLQYFLTLLCVSGIVASLLPELRGALRLRFRPDSRQVLATARGDLRGDGSSFTVAKVQTRDTLLLEVYASQEDGLNSLIERIPLLDQKDGFFSFNGHATNLVIDDLDGNGRGEILAPTFDHDLVGHVNIYSYNPLSGSFERRLQ